MLAKCFSWSYGIVESVCSKDCQQVLKSWRDGAPIRTLAVHLMNQIVGSGFSLIPSNDYKYSTHDNPISRRRLSADKKKTKPLTMLMSLSLPFLNLYRYLFVCLPNVFVGVMGLLKACAQRTVNRF